MRIKCPHCKGKGFSELNSAVNMTCGWCMGQGELDLEIVPTEPLTEQEYLQTCTTEQLANFIIGERKGCVYADCPNGETPCMSCKDGCDINKLVEWLNQPHTFIDY